MLADNTTFAISRAPATARAATAAPSDDRLPALDVLRGIALAFMILVHFHQLLRLETMTGLEDLIAWGVWIFVEEKAWGTFAMLFGAGIALLDRRLVSRGAPVTRVLLRRLLVLFALGLVMKRTMGFSILEIYGWWGLALVALRTRSTRTLLGVAVASAMARPVVASLWGIYAWSAKIPTAWPAWLGETLSWVLPDTSFPLMLLGALAVRVGVVDDPRRHARLIAGWIAFGAGAWGLWWLLYNVVPPKLPIPALGWSARTVVGLVQQQWLAIAYAGGALLLLAARPALRQRLAFLGAAGRMAFTNYLVQAAVIWVLAKPLGVKMGAYAYVASSAALVAVLVILSNAWLRHFRMGPFEWLWRVATYARVEPLRRTRAVLVAAALAAMMILPAGLMIAPATGLAASAAEDAREETPPPASVLTRWVEDWPVRAGVPSVTVARLLGSSPAAHHPLLHAALDGEDLPHCPPWVHGVAYLARQVREWLAWMTPDAVGALRALAGGTTPR